MLYRASDDRFWQVLPAPWTSAFLSNLAPWILCVFALPFFGELKRVYQNKAAHLSRARERLQVFAGSTRPMNYWFLLVLSTNLWFFSRFVLASIVFFSYFALCSFTKGHISNATPWGYPLFRGKPTSSLARAKCPFKFHFFRKNVKVVTLLPNEGVGGRQPWGWFESSVRGPRLGAC